MRLRLLICNRYVEFGRGFYFPWFGWGRIIVGDYRIVSMELVRDG